MSATSLETVRDWIAATYGHRALDFWTGVAASDGSILPSVDSGDGIHLNDVGHAMLYASVINSGVLRGICGLLFPFPPIKF